MFIERGIIMADIDKNNVQTNDGDELTVDDILAEILNSDGSFKDEFNGLAAKYIVDETILSSSKIDLSDRRDEPGIRDKAIYESGDIRFTREKSVDERIEEKIPDEFREIYSEASSEAQRPEYTSTGNVKYPTMGVGASEQRVVYDAEWEAKAKAEAARLERARQDRMLRGDSTYVRSFVAGSAYRARKNPFIDDLSDAPSVPVSPTGALYIDPLSKDDDFEGKSDSSQYYNDNKKPFFPEGFSVIQKNKVAASGKTEKTSGGKSITASGNDSFYTGKSGMVSKQTSESNTDWLKVDDKYNGKKKKSSYRKKGKKDAGKQPVGKVTDRIRVDESVKALPEKNETADSENKRKRVYLYDGKDVKTVADETKGLRSTVAEIVDKYNKRSEEDEKKRLAEISRLEEEKRIAQQQKEERRAHIEMLKKGMSPELADAVDDAEKEDSVFDEYEDFSTIPVRNSKGKSSRKAAPAAKTPEKKFAGENYLEKLNDSSDEAGEASEDNEEKEKNGKNKQKMQPKKNTRRKDKK